MVEFITILVLLGLGYGFGKNAERRHYQSIKARESRWAQVPAMTFKQPPEDRAVASSDLVTGSVVVSVDYFKRFLTGFRMFFGGELRSYASLIDRARREALLRMREQAPEADAFLNVRMETSSIAQGRKDALGTVEVLAYATAIRYSDEVRPETTG